MRPQIRDALYRHAAKYLFDLKGEANDRLESLSEYAVTQVPTGKHTPHRTSRTTRSPKQS